MVVPERTEPEHQPAQRRVSSLGVLGGLGLAIVAFVALGNLTAVETPAEPPTTTLSLDQPTTTAVFSARGGPLQSQLVLSGDGQGFLGMVAGEEAHHLFVSVETDDEGWQVGVETMISADGMSWESLGVVIPPSERVAGVTGTESGFLAYGHGRHQESMTVWASEDGATWDQVTVPLDGGETVYLSGALATDGALLVYGNASTSTDGVWESISSVMEAEYGSLGRQFDYHPTTMGVYAVTVWGPLGIPLVSTTTEELGLEPETLTPTPAGPTRATVWSTADGVVWERSEIPELAYVQEIIPAPDGLIRLFGYSQGGSLSVFTSRDGRTWEAADRIRADLGLLQRSGNSWVGSSSYGPAVLVSSDLDQWESTGIGELFGSARPWWVSQLAADGSRIAAVVSSAGEPTFIDPEPLQVERSGYTMRVTNTFLSIIKPGTDTVLLRVSTWSPVANPAVSYDHDTGIITFVDLGTGEILMTFTLEELEAIEAEWGGGGQVDRDELNVLVVTNGSGDLVSHEFPLGGDGYSYPVDMGFAGDRLLLVVNWYDPAVDGVGGFELHSVALPFDR